MSHSCLWISGTSRSGKTTRLIKEFQNWVTGKPDYDSSKNSIKSRLKPLTATVRTSHGGEDASPPVSSLIFAANGQRRNRLEEDLSNAVEGSYPLLCQTPLGFIRKEVTLFLPLLLHKVKAQLPLILRPETEQDLATKLWRPNLSLEQNQLMGGQTRLVRRLLDLLQLAAASCTPLESIPELLKNGFDTSIMIDPDLIGKLLLDWRQWCKSRGLLTYGLIYDLYWSDLLPHQDYRQNLIKRYEMIFADDLDDYPAIARDLLEFWLGQNKPGIFTYNPDGQVRQGLNADPEYLQGLSCRCLQEKLERTFPYEIISIQNKNQLLGRCSLASVSDAGVRPQIPSDRWRLIQTTTRAELLRQVSQVIIEKVTIEGVKPGDIAIIAPGLDEIARYTLIEILTHHAIPIEPLNEQRPLISSPLVRALLTLLALVYPNLGALVTPEAIAEMLVVMSPSIDPVRAGLLADYCYQIDKENPNLLAVYTFSRWDRIGARATYAYQNLTNWLSQQKQRVQKQTLNPVEVINQAIQAFLSDREELNYAKLAVLRKFVETAQHYWELQTRLRENQAISLTEILTDFIALLRSEIITANPYPLLPISDEQGKITLATIFQYRAKGSEHPWQFWLDIGSSLWAKGGTSMLWGAPLFWRSRRDSLSGTRLDNQKVLTPEEESIMESERLERIVKDLQARATEGIYLCHSELNVNGSEQSGPLLPLIY